MYKIKDIVYSEAGHIIKNSGFSGYSYKGELSDFTEEKLDINKFYINKSNIIFIDNVIIGKYDPNKAYADYKTSIIKSRYSNDDQIAIMLNKDNSSEDLDRFNKMQEWRIWASTLSHLIVEYKNKERE